MPKYIQPEDGCGLLLRAVIEGELFINVPGIQHRQVIAIVDAIEARIHAGPADWLALSDGTTFEKTFVPYPVAPEPWIFLTGSPDQVQRACDAIHAAHEERVAANSRKEDLENEIVAFEKFLQSYCGGTKIYL